MQRPMLNGFLYHFMFFFLSLSVSFDQFTKAKTKRMIKVDCNDFYFILDMYYLTRALFWSMRKNLILCGSHFHCNAKYIYSKDYIVAVFCVQSCIAKNVAKA